MAILGSGHSLAQEGRGPHSVQSYENFSWSHGRINFRRLEGAYARLASPDTVDGCELKLEEPGHRVQSEQKMPERP
jgi:hypothetical protein